MELDMQRASYSVSEITRRVKELLEADEGLEDIWIEGEISNWVRSRAGHCYFTLKDAQAAIRAVMWRSIADRLGFDPEDGQAVRAHGYVSVYEPQGQYQFYVDALQSTGRGALYLKFEALKARLAAEGLFDANRKRPLPYMPSCIGVVTSPTGAALRDILNVLRRRWPLVRVLIAPSLVQGTHAPVQIISALHSLYARTGEGSEPRVNVIIVARGGGSIEDLWAFNDERVARAIAGAPVPVISGVGHETDFTIADFCADARAPTPSAAAEIAVPDYVETKGQLEAQHASLDGAWRQLVGAYQSSLDTERRALVGASPRRRIDVSRQRVDEVGRRLDRAGSQRLSLLQERVMGLEQRLTGLDPLAILARGYAAVRDQSGRLVHSAADVSIGERIDVLLSDGQLSADVQEIEHNRAQEASVHD
jgi:exodeoxyribonuclease VII large subunit